LEERVILPETLDEAYLFAAVGAPLKALLLYNPTQDVQTTLACMRALAVMHDTHSLQAYQADKRPEIQQEYAWLHSREALNALQPRVRMISWDGRPALFVHQIRSLKKIHVLELIPHFPQRLVLKGTFRDLTPLTHLSALTGLALLSKHIRDLTPLAGLTRLAQLSLTGTPLITDLAPLTTLSQLSILTLTGLIELTDIQPLASLPALRSLAILASPKLTTITPLLHLPSLRHLELPPHLRTAPEIAQFRQRGILLRFTEIRGFGKRPRQR
jgi:hypothetical protein